MTEFRYERKYVIPQIFKGNILTVIRNHPFMFKEIYDERTVNNIYFDTPDLHNYFETKEGVHLRHKVRIRWYNNDFSHCYFEIKSKKGDVVLKKTIKMGKININENLRKTLTTAIASSELDKNLKMPLLKLVPTCINSYHRRYFESRNHKFRVTLDYDLKFKAVRSSKVQKGTCFRLNNMVIEVKYDTSSDIDINDFTRFFPLRISKFSKYTTGVEAF